MVSPFVLLANEAHMNDENLTDGIMHLTTYHFFVSTKKSSIDCPIRSTQVKKYGPVPAGRHWKSPEHGSSIPTGKFSDFFR
jgi:hypothetical protein